MRCKRLEKIMRKFPVVFLMLLMIAEKAFPGSENRELEISFLDRGVYLHTSFKHIEGYGLVGSNGLVVLEEGKAYIVDTPWSPEDTEKLVGWVEDKGYVVKSGLSTHSHEDRAGGIGFLNSESVTTYTSELTDRILKESGKERAEITFSGSGFSLGSGLIEIFYPGAGHTVDNLVVWLPKSKILFGGCLVRSVSDENLGYVGEASIDSWEGSIDNLIARYPEAGLVVPGHGLQGGVELLKHTKRLAKAASGKSIKPNAEAPAD